MNFLRDFTARKLLYVLLVRGHLNRKYTVCAHCKKYGTVPMLVAGNKIYSQR